MNYALKNPAMQFPPGGFGFVDPRTKRVFNGWEGTAPMQAVKIIEHRRGNPKIYPPEEGQWFDQKSVTIEVLAQKFKEMPHLFLGQPDKDPSYPSQPVARETIVKGAACSCGCTEFIAEYCKTCSGARIVGRKCKSCGKAA